MGKANEGISFAYSYRGINSFYLQAIYCWFKNNKPCRNRAVFCLERRIPIQRVVAKLKAAEIHGVMMKEYPCVEKGSSEYPGLFQKAVSIYISTMDTPEKEEKEKIRTEWQNSGPPRDVQLR